jgi:hypothetical protein
MYMPLISCIFQILILCFLAKKALLVLYSYIYFCHFSHLLTCAYTVWATSPESTVVFMPGNEFTFPSARPSLCGG